MAGGTDFSRIDWSEPEGCFARDNVFVHTVAPPEYLQKTLNEGSTIRFVDWAALRKNDTYKEDVVAALQGYAILHDCTSPYMIPEGYVGVYTGCDYANPGYLEIEQHDAQHQFHLVPLTAEKAFMTINFLYEIGWNPATGKLNEAAHGNNFKVMFELTIGNNRPDLIDPIHFLQECINWGIKDIPSMAFDIYYPSAMAYSYRGMDVNIPSQATERLKTLHIHLDWSDQVDTLIREGNFVSLDQVSMSARAMRDHYDGPLKDVLDDRTFTQETLLAVFKSMDHEFIRNFKLLDEEYVREYYEDLNMIGGKAPSTEMAALIFPSALA